MNIKSIFKTSLMISLTSLVLPMHAAEGDSSEQGFSDTNIQYSYTNSAKADWLLGYGSDDGDRQQLRFEHQSLWAYGENYVFVDVVSGGSTLGDDCAEFGLTPAQATAFLCNDGNDKEVFGLYNGNLSLSKISQAVGGSPMKFGPLKDVTLEWRFEYGSFFNYDAKSYGLSLYFDVPWYVDKVGDKVQFTWWRRDNCDDFVTALSGGCYEDHNYWGLTTRKEWEMLGLNWTHQIFWRYQQNTGGDPVQKRGSRHFAEFELIADVWRGFGLGVRLEYFSDKGGINASGDTNDFRPMVLARYRF